MLVGSNLFAADGKTLLFDLKAKTEPEFLHEVLKAEAETAEDEYYYEEEYVPEKKSKT